MSKKNKRGNGEGSFRQKANGRWECQLMIGRDAKTGKRTIKSFSGSTRGEVKKKMDAYLLKEKSNVLEAETLLFCDFADQWFEHHKHNLSEASVESYGYTLRILKNHFSNQAMASIKAIRIENFLRELRCTYSDSTVSKCRGMLFQIFNRAVGSDLLAKNPVAFAEKMKKKKSMKCKDSFTAEEVRLLMDNLPEDRVGWSIRLLLSTGMRTQELLGLEPRHIAKNGSTIVIQQALVRVRGSVAIGPPKSRDSFRSIPVPPMTQYCARLLRDTEDRFIWNSPKVTNQPCNPSYFADQFEKSLKQVEGVRILTPHCCRHTYISQMQALGVSIETIQSIVGHADIEMTKHYLHVQENIRLDAVARFSETFSRKGDCIKNTSTHPQKMKTGTDIMAQGSKSEEKTTV